MKLNTIKSALLAVAGALLISQSANAATTSYTAGDLLMGITVSGSGTTYIVNLGQAGTFRDAGFGTITLGLGNIGSDLTTIYGANWYSTAVWGISGTVGTTALSGDPLKTLYVSQAEGSPELLNVSGSNHTNANSAMSAMATAYSGKDTGSYLNLAQSDSAGNAYSSYVGVGGTSWNYFSNMQASVGSDLDLYRLVGPGTFGGATTVEGTFSLANDGTVTFTVVPEPSTYALMFLGASLLFWSMKRRSSSLSI